MVLAIDIGNTTIAFTGLELTETEVLTPCPARPDSVPASPQSPEDEVSGVSDEAFGAVDRSAAPVKVFESAEGADTSDEAFGSVNFEIVFSEKIPTETGKDTAVFLRESGLVLGRYSIGTAEADTRAVDAVAISSVVPACTPAAKILAEKICKSPPVVINWKCNTGLSFEEIPVPDRVGADRVADSAWAAARYPLPVMTVDMGTATTINIVSADRKFLGGMIGAGVRTALHSLRTGTAQLPELLPGPVPPEKLIGKDTAGCMLSAAVVGTAAMIDGLAGHVEEQIGSPLTLILTGGNANAVSEWIRHSYVLEPGLAAKGSALIALRETGIQ